MDHEALESKYGPDIEVDLCFGCHVLWLDKRESIQLSAGGTLALFKLLHAHTDDPRQSLRAAHQCPRCAGPLELMHDIGKGGRFSYYRCPKHGRLTPFSEFLREKEFVRSLNPLEKQQLSAEVKQVQCSSCGAPIKLSRGFECGHCGSALTVLDGEAVSRTLRELDEADAARKAIDPAAAEQRARAMSSLETYRTDPDPRAPGADLLSSSLNTLFRLLG